MPCRDFTSTSGHRASRQLIANCVLTCQRTLGFYRAFSASAQAQPRQKTVLEDKLRQSLTEYHVPLTYKDLRLPTSMATNPHQHYYLPWLFTFTSSLPLCCSALHQKGRKLYPQRDTPTMRPELRPPRNLRSNWPQRIPATGEPLNNNKEENLSAAARLLGPSVLRLAIPQQAKIHLKPSATAITFQEPSASTTTTMGFALGARISAFIAIARSSQAS